MCNIFIFTKKRFIFTEISCVVLITQTLLGLGLDMRCVRCPKTFIIINIDDFQSLKRHPITIGSSIVKSVYAIKDTATYKYINIVHIFVISTYVHCQLSQFRA